MSVINSNGNKIEARNIALKFFSSLWFQILLLSVISILWQGYDFGIGNQSSLIPYLKSYINPSLYLNDPYITTRYYYFSYFWRILSFIAKYVKIDILFFAIYFITRFLTFISLYFLSDTLFKDKLTNYISILFFFGYVDTILGGGNLNWYYMSHTTFVFPILLFSFLFFLKKRYELAFIILGIAFNLHFLNTMFVASFYFVYLLINFKKINIKRQMVCFVLFLLFSSPTILWLLISNNQHIAVDYKLVDLLKIRFPHHMLPFTWNPTVWLKFLIFTNFFIISLRFKPSREKHLVIMTSIATVGLIYLIGFCLSQIFLWWPVMLLHPFRSADFYCLFAVIYMANFCRVLLMSDSIQEILIGSGCFISLFLNSYIHLLPFTYAFYSLRKYYLRNPNLSQQLSINFFLILTILSPGLIYVLESLYPSDNYGRLVRFGLIGCLAIFILSYSPSVRSFLSSTLVKRSVILFSIFTVIFLVTGRILSRISSGNYGTHSCDSSWLDIQSWAKNNTSNNATFIVPPYLDGFRVFSERGIFVDSKSGDAMCISSFYAKTWWGRMRELGIDKEAYAFDEGKFSYAHLNKNDFLRISKKYSIYYLVTEKPQRLEFELVYENQKFNVYFIQAE